MRISYFFFLLSSSLAARFCSFLPCTEQEASHRLHHPFEKTESRICSALFCSSPSAALALWVRISLIFGFLDFSFHARRPPSNAPVRLCLLKIPGM
ncbi:hypothetical protein SLEP1_g3929 [Rubroshorea leprosula]|uniref:Secreted protein n=1 Tax=Rubroshorea leprosula TaxID=152421 RepID=A0AAV5HXJ8_9ROSI|nr:hypothetical protein SLEP1_g3929 [Rubroshorea leprosula]